MTTFRYFEWILFLSTLLMAAVPVRAEQSGGIRGTIYDKDFDAPLGAAQVMIAETGETATTSGEGNYSFTVEPGNYTLVFSKEGYTRQVAADVVVSPGQMTEVDASLAGEFVEMEEFIVQDIQIGTGTEAALLELRLESPALMDSVSSELMSQAGASDAASALRLVAGATVQEGKYATVRGLPDRYVNSQMNAVRLPTADIDKRAVELDQFPASVIESIQVTKTFTPDQQGDASGGAVNVVLKGIPEESFIKVSSSMSWNKNVTDAKENFLTYKGAGLDYWASSDGISPQYDKIGMAWDGALGVTTDDPGNDYKWSVALGGKKEFEDFKLGGFASIFYERDSSYYGDKIDDKYIVDNVEISGDAPYRMTPSVGSRPVFEEDMDPFETSLFDVKQGSQSVKWGGLGIVGFETEYHQLKLLYMFTRDAESTATLAEDTRGRESLYKYWPDQFPADYDGISFRDSIFSYPEGHGGIAPPTRNQTLEYTERRTETLQFSGKHTLFDEIDIGIENFFMLLPPELDWTYAVSSATFNQPDKRQLSVIWNAHPDISPHYPGLYEKPPLTSGTLGNIQRIWKYIEEESEQYFINVKFPFEQWSGDRGYLKLGVFNDEVNRIYNQDTYTNLNDVGNLLGGMEWDDYWSEILATDENRHIDEALIDVDYTGDQKIEAWYYMLDVPLTSYFNVIGGVRYESTNLNIVNYPDEGGVALWYNPESYGMVLLQEKEADVDFKQDDILPSIGFNFQPYEQLIFRGTYSETVARQTFKELTPIQQSEYVGADVFVGNPFLKMSSLKNYDLRLDWTPYEGGLISGSYFYKDIRDVIEYVQVNGTNDVYTRPDNYPTGEITGYEFEIRQRLGRFVEMLEGLSVGANATFIDSEVILPKDEADALADLGVAEPKRDMTNAPEYLYNLYATYKIPRSGTELAVFYTVRGDTLTAGAARIGSGATGQYTPSIYEKEYGTLNMSVSQELWDNWKFKFSAKNLLDPAIETVYRSRYIEGGEHHKTSYRKGMEFSISLSCTF